MPHMQTEVVFGTYFEVDTTHGTEIVPTDACGHTMTTVAEALRMPDYEVDSWYAECPVKEGWLARLSAPGYLDCTDWSAFETETEAREFLEEFYGED